MSLEVEDRIISLLKESRRTAIELTDGMYLNNIRCPDDLARTLSQMRKKGLIHGEFSEEKSTWVYWADQE